MLFGSVLHMDLIQPFTYLTDRETDRQQSRVEREERVYIAKQNPHPHLPNAKTPSIFQLELGPLT